MSQVKCSENLVKEITLDFESHTIVHVLKILDQWSKSSLEDKLKILFLKTNQKHGNIRFFLKKIIPYVTLQKISDKFESQ